MSKNSSVEIRFHEAEMIVSPSLKGINRLKQSRQMWEQVAVTLSEPRSSSVTDLVIDLGDVTWISSVGLNELIRLQAQTRASGITLRLSSVAETVRDVFRLTRLERTFQFEDREDGAAAFESDAEPSERSDSVVTA